MIDFEHVSKEYKKGGKLALEDVNFHVDDGEFVFLLGHSGAGKSTLLTSMAIWASLKLVARSLTLAMGVPMPTTALM